MLRNQPIWRPWIPTDPGADDCGHANPPRASSTALTLIAALGFAIVVAAMIAPVVAGGLWKGGFRFPFARIFDRTVMLMFFAALFLLARRLKIVALLRQGFCHPERGMGQALSGLVLADAAIAVLFALAAVAGAHIHGSMIIPAVIRYFPAAVLIAVIEEAFFRAFLLAGIRREFGVLGALFASSAVYAIAHVMRSPAHFYLKDFEPWAGAETLGAYAERLIHPEAGPPLLGLFLLGVVLGEAFLLTRSAYASIGLHTGFILGAKTWRLAIGGAIPQWLAGGGPVPLVSAPAAWIVSLITLVLLYLCSQRSASFSGPEALSERSPVDPRGSER
jgi:membrane protease YdiL (CAAX protease family)